MKRTASTSPGTAPRTAIGPCQAMPLRLLLTIVGTFSPGNVLRLQVRRTRSVSAARSCHRGRRSAPAAGHRRTRLLSSTVTGRAGGESCSDLPRSARARQCDTGGPQSRPPLTTVRRSPLWCPAVAILSREPQLGRSVMADMERALSGNGHAVVADSAAGWGHDCRGRPAGR